MGDRKRPWLAVIAACDKKEIQLGVWVDDGACAWASFGGLAVWMCCDAGSAIDVGVNRMMAATEAKGLALAVIDDGAVTKASVRRAAVSFAAGTMIPAT